MSRWVGKHLRHFGLSLPGVCVRTHSQWFVTLLESLPSCSCQPLSKLWNKSLNISHHFQKYKQQWEGRRSSQRRHTEMQSSRLAVVPFVDLSKSLKTETFTGLMKQLRKQKIHSSIQKFFFFKSNLSRDECRCRP